ncbi:MAG: ArgE/DapE family deacylase [Candidatus Lokiarchaeota archaeon]|nr:ArgE/DapE family deacylase [Candidatus Lokiarchaeota archaeon]
MLNPREMTEELIKEYIDDKREEFIDFLVNLIQTDSYNPPGNELNLAKIIKNYLDKDGIKNEIFKFGNNRANLVAYLNNNFKFKNLIFNGHMDVVPSGNVSEWKYHPLSGEIKRNKYIYGRGSTDMKGGLAAMIISLKVLKSLNIKLDGNLILHSVADEETIGDEGTEWIIKNISNSIDCNFTVIGEPTGFKPLPKSIIFGERGHLQIRIIANGISSHSSFPAMGKNAIYMINDLINNIDKIDDYIPKVNPPITLDELKQLVSVTFPDEQAFIKFYNEQPLIQNFIKVFTTLTKSVTIIKGGIKDNVIPNICEITMDFRLLPLQKTEDIISAIRRIINECGYKMKDQIEGENDIFFDYDILLDKEASYWKNWRDSEEIKLFYNIVNKIYLQKPYYFLFPACSDAVYYRNSNYCEKTILFGPGNASLAHASNESIELNDFINSIKVYALFAYNFLKKKENIL